MTMKTGVFKAEERLGPRKNDYHMNDPFKDWYLAI